MNEKRKVLHILSSNRFSGAENVACQIIKMFEGEYEMYYCSPKGSIEKKLKEENVKYIGIDKLNYKNLKKVVSELKPHIIYAHDYRASCFATLLSKKTKIISHLHSNNLKRRKFNFQTLLFYILSKKISKIIWVSNSAYDNFYFQDNTSIKNKSIILYNIINDTEVLSKANENIIKENYDLVFLGRLVDVKNPERLIEIIRKVKIKKNDIKLAIIGDGEKKQKLQKLISDYGLESSVNFLGYLSNPFPFLKKSKLMVMTSIYEGTPMAALEAQCLGLPIISTPVDGLVDIIKNNENGFLSDNNNELAEKIIEVLNDDSILSKMRQNSINNFKVINNKEQYKQKIKNVLE